MNRSRAEIVAEQIANLARAVGAGARIGSRDELRALTSVSVGTLHESLRLLQSTGEITVRTGPGGGVFAGESSALSELIRSIRARGIDATSFPQTARVLAALRPLVFADAIDNLTPVTAALLRDRLAVLEAARVGDVHDLVRASLEVFATIVSIPPPGVLTTVAASILRMQLDTLRGLYGRIDQSLRADADDHVDAVSHLVDALIAADLSVAIECTTDPRFMALFATIADTDYGNRADAAEQD